MNDTAPPPPPAPPPPQGPPPSRTRWQRPTDRRVIAGVASGAADALGIGVGWIRAAFIVAFLFGGLALPLYVAGWVLMPRSDERDSLATKWIGNLGGEGVRWIGIGLIVVAGIVLLSTTGFIRGGWIWAGALLVVGVLLYRGDIDVPSRPESPPTETYDPSAVYGASAPASGRTDLAEADGDPSSDSGVAEYAATARGGGDAASGSPYVPAPPPPPPPPRPRSILGRLTFAAILLTIGATALLDNLDVASPDFRHYVAGVFAVLGVALIVGAWWGRVRGAIVVGILLLPLLMVTTLVRIPFEGDIGEVTYSPASAAEIESPYELAIGELRVDLRDLEEDAEIRADLGIGLLWVIVPADADLFVTGEIGIGELDLLDLTRGGLGVDRTVTSAGPGPDLVLDLEVGIGELRVDRASR